jgi:hypothetical protein
VYFHITLRTGMTVLEAERRLASLVRSPQTLRQPPYYRPADSTLKPPFVGRVGEARFKFHRLFIGRNSFIPIVTGRIVEGAGGAELRMVVRPGVPVFIFVAGMVGVLVSMTAVDPGPAPALALIGVFMLGISAYYFFQEKRRTLQALQDAFPGATVCKDSIR